MTILKLVHEISKDIETIELAHNKAWWQLSTTGDEKYAEELENSIVALKTLLSNKENCHLLKNRPKTEDTLLNREAEILLHQFQENQTNQELIKEIASLEAEIETDYTNFRPTIDGKASSNNDLKKILLENPDENIRKEAWDASKLIGNQVEKKVLKLIKLRNTSAQDSGFKDFYSMRLKLQELDEERLFDLLDELEEKTKTLWKNYKASLDENLSKRYGLSPNQLMPWHYQDPFFQEAPVEELDFDPFYKDLDLVAIGRRFFKTIGLDVDDVLGRSDLYERDKKNQHAFCMCLDRRQDVRILCNMRDNEYWMSVLAHELGHAVYDKYIDQTLPFLLRTVAHTSTTEASAMLFGRLSKDEHFLKEYANAAHGSIKQITPLAKKQTAANLLVFMRWAMVMISFERDMYQKKNADLNALWWDYVERFQGVKRPPHRHKPDWAAKLHLACAPVYYQNYLIGEMTASQLLAYLKKQLGNDFYTSPETGDILIKRLYRLGAKFPWEETLLYATDEKLNPDYFIADIDRADKV